MDDRYKVIQWATAEIMVGGSDARFYESRPNIGRSRQQSTGDKSSFGSSNYYVASEGVLNI